MSVRVTIPFEKSDGLLHGDGGGLGALPNVTMPFEKSDGLLQ